MTLPHFRDEGPAAPPSAEASRAAELRALFRQAQAAHRGGERAEAERLYRAILDRDPENGPAQHYLGVLAHQAGQHAEAIRLIGEALKKAPGDAGAHCNIAQAFRATRRGADAEFHLRVAVELAPDMAEAQGNLGLVLLERSLGEEALLHLNRTLELDPTLAFAREALVRAALAPAGTAPPPVSEQAALHARVANALADAKRRVQALPHIRRAIDLAPNEPRFHVDLGNLLVAWDALEAAEESFRKAAALAPSSARAWSSLGICLYHLDRGEESIAAFGRALAIEPDHYLVHWNMSLVLLMLGRYREGWEAFERRWQLSNVREFKGPKWDGGDLAGRTLLLHAEQGLGDTLQCLRYLPLCVAKGGKVKIWVQPLLARLMPEIEGVALLRRAEIMPEFDAQAPLMSLPRLFGTMPDTIPPPLSGLVVPDTAVARRVAASAGIKVGIVWAGNPKHVNDLRRSCPLALLAPLFDVEGTSWFSLQKGPQAAELAGVPFGGRVISLGAELEDLADTAAVLRVLDLVITVDTAVAHLAGSLGVPGWVLLSHVADWRWFAGRDTSPWYPSLTLFRQARRGDWPELAQRVAASLRSLVQARAEAAPIRFE